MRSAVNEAEPAPTRRYSCAQFAAIVIRSRTTTSAETTVRRPLRLADDVHLALPESSELLADWPDPLDELPEEELQSQGIADEVIEQPAHDRTAIEDSTSTIRSSSTTSRVGASIHRPCLLPK